eukprot:2398407-Pleurochrysis_carterae.AAC.1
MPLLMPLPAALGPCVSARGSLVIGSRGRGPSPKRVGRSRRRTGSSAPSRAERIGASHPRTSHPRAPPSPPQRGGTARSYRIASRCIGGSR